MAWSWFDLAWPWIGLAIAVGLLAVLLATSLFRSAPGEGRWRDPLWLSALSVPAYMAHQVEEYGLDALGRLHAFPSHFCHALGLAPYPACPLPPPFYLAVNLSLVWIAAPVAVLLARGAPLAGMALYGVIGANAVIHLIPAVLGGGYNPGTLTSVVLFAPLMVWIGRSCFGRGRPFGWADLALVLGLGFFAHAVLAASVQLFLRGVIGQGALVALQLVNAAALVLLLWGRAAALRKQVAAA